MPPMPGSMSRGPFMRALQRIANTSTPEGLLQIRGALASGAQHVDILGPLAHGDLGDDDISHLARHWYRENPGKRAEAVRDERWWRSLPTDETVRFGIIRGLDLIVEAQRAGKKTYVDCLWICRGESIEVANMRTEHAGMVYINFILMTPPMPRSQSIIDARENYTGSEEIWLTTPREGVLYGGAPLPGFLPTLSSPTAEAASNVVTVEVQSADGRYAGAQTAT